MIESSVDGFVQQKSGTKLRFTWSFTLAFAGHVPFVASVLVLVVTIGLVLVLVLVLTHDLSLDLGLGFGLVLALVYFILSLTWSLYGSPTGHSHHYQLCKIKALVLVLVFGLIFGLVLGPA